MKPNGLRDGKDQSSYEQTGLSRPSNPRSQQDRNVLYYILYHYDYMVPKYGLEKLELCYIDTDSLVYDIKTEDFYEDTANDVEARFNTSGYS